MIVIMINELLSNYPLFPLSLVEETSHLCLNYKRVKDTYSSVK
jgi:hypothetical protein